MADKDEEIERIARIGSSLEIANVGERERRGERGGPFLFPLLLRRRRPLYIAASIHPAQQECGVMAFTCSERAASNGALPLYLYRSLSLSSMGNRQWLRLCSGKPSMVAPHSTPLLAHATDPAF